MLEIWLWDADDHLVETFKSLDACIKFIDGYADPPFFTIEIRDGQYCITAHREQFTDMHTYEGVS